MRDGTQSALTIGCGWPDGRVYGVDISEGMLAIARAAVEQSAMANVTLLRTDASEFELPETVDGAIFSLSYAVMRDRKQVLRRAWEQLKPGGRLVLLDAKVRSGFFGRVMYPLLSWVLKLTVLGNPDVDELRDLRELNGTVEVEELQFGTYFIARVTKTAGELDSIS